MDEIIGGLIINVGFVAAAAYIPLQLFTLLKWAGGWRWLALAPLIVMVPVIAWSVMGLAQESNLWPLLLIFASPFAALYLVILLVFRAVSDRGATDSGVGSATPQRSSL